MEQITAQSQNSDNTPTPQSTPSPQPESPTPDTQHTQEKHKNNRTLKLGIGLLVLISCVLALYLTSAEKKKQQIVPQKPVLVEKPIEDPYPIDDDATLWKEYTNQKYEFYLKYPTNGVLTQYDISQEEPSVYKIYFTPNKTQLTNLENVNESDISEGFIFKVTVVKNIELKTPQAAATEKINYFKSYCPGTAKISQLETGDFSGFESQLFTVKDCRGNYQVTYVKRKTNMYEISQFTTGDVGFEQKYKNTTDKMLGIMKLTNTIAPVPIEKWVDFEDQGIKLKHPQMDDKCCSISGPITLDEYNDPVTIVVLAMPKGVNTTGTSFNGIGVFYIDDLPDEEAISKYVQAQKNALIEEYKIIIGRSPEVQESTISVAGVNATLIKGVAWWGDIVFVPYKQRNGRNVIYMVAKTEVLKGEFETLFSEILATIQFSETK